MTGRRIVTWLDQCPSSRSPYGRRTSIRIRSSSSPPGLRRRAKPASGRPRRRPWPPRRPTAARRSAWCWSSRPARTGSCSTPTSRAARAASWLRIPRAALLFHWDQLGRQVRIEGRVVRLSAGESAAYVRSRPRGSQISALASPQSRTVDSREQLEQRVAELTAAHEGAELPLPDTWGGFRVLPESFEFWQHREDRLHDRLRYTLTPDRRLAARAPGAPPANARPRGTRSRSPWVSGRAESFGGAEAGRLGRGVEPRDHPDRQARRPAPRPARSRGRSSARAGPARRPGLPALPATAQRRHPMPPAARTRRETGR